MPNKKNAHFDERQVQIRNKVGHQCFFVLYFLLLIDLLIADYGVAWAASPISIVIIMLSCSGYYLIRIVWAGAYSSGSSESRKHGYLMLCLVAAITTLIAITKTTNLFQESLNISGGGLLRLLLFLFVLFAIVLVSHKLSERKSN